MKDLQISQKLFNLIHMIRGKRIILDRDLAELYGG